MRERERERERKKERKRERVRKDAIKRWRDKENERVYSFMYLPFLTLFLPPNKYLCLSLSVSLSHSLLSNLFCILFSNLPAVTRINFSSPYFHKTFSILLYLIFSLLLSFPMYLPTSTSFLLLLPFSFPL